MGQVWHDLHSSATRTIDRVDETTGDVWYTLREDGCTVSHDCKAIQFHDAVRVLKWYVPSAEVPAPIPHPSALGNLYEACKALVDGRLIADVDSAPLASVPEAIRVSRMVRAALAKSEGRTP